MLQRLALVVAAAARADLPHRSGFARSPPRLTLCLRLTYPVAMAAASAPIAMREALTVRIVEQILCSDGVCLFVRLFVRSLVLEWLGFQVSCFLLRICEMRLWCSRGERVCVCVDERGRVWCGGGGVGCGGRGTDGLGWCNAADEPRD